MKNFFKLLGAIIMLICNLIMAVCSIVFVGVMIYWFYHIMIM